MTPTADATLRPHAEQEYADELAALARPTTGRVRRAGGCRRGRWSPTCSAARSPTAP